MFRQFATTIPGGAELLFRLHPVELAALLEQAWEFRKHDTSRTIGHPDRRSDIPGLPEYLLEAFDGFQRNRETFRGGVKSLYLPLTREPGVGEAASVGSTLFTLM